MCSPAGPSSETCPGRPSDPVRSGSGRECRDRGPALACWCSSPSGRPGMISRDVAGRPARSSARVVAAPVPLLACPGRGNGLRPLGRCRRAAPARRPRNRAFSGPGRARRSPSGGACGRDRDLRADMASGASPGPGPRPCSGCVLPGLARRCRDPAPVAVLMPERPLAPALITAYVCIGTLQHANLRWTFGSTLVPQAVAGSGTAALRTCAL
jgi:hypothetical protein